MRSVTTATCALFCVLAAATSALAQDQTAGSAESARIAAAPEPAAKSAVEPAVVAPAATPTLAPAPSADVSAVPAPVPASRPVQAATAADNNAASNNTPSATPSSPPAEAPATTTSTAPQPSSTPAVAAAQATPVIDPVIVAVQSLLAGLENDKSIDKADVAALKTYYGAPEVRPVWVKADGMTDRAGAAMREIGAADEWGLSASAYDLPAAALGTTVEARAEAELTLSRAILLYARHARGGRMDPTDLSYNIDRQPPLLEPLKVLADAASTPEVGTYLRKLHPQHPQFELLRQKYLEARRAESAGVKEAVAEEPAGAPQTKGKASAKTKPARPEAKLAQRLLYNMEMWRWMPEDLGDVHVVSNIPEFMVRVVKSDAVVHEERIIIGKIANQTPIFSDMMEHIVFHPFWGVPDSIKVKEIWPSLLGNGSAIHKNGLRIQRGGRDIDPSSVNWSTTDIRQFHVYQPPGSSNVLGVVKFMFPNKHQVYMHDTPTKNLFNSQQRTFSHGCMRVRDPVRLAEVLLEQDKGWQPARVAALVKGGPQNNHVYMDRKIPVHVTYFTAVVDKEGNLKTFPDVYGHEPKIKMGIEGKAHLIVKTKPSLTPPDAVSRLSEAKPSGSNPDWMKKVFGGIFQN